MHKLAPPATTEGLNDLYHFRSAAKSNRFLLAEVACFLQSGLKSKLLKSKGAPLEAEVDQSAESSAHDLVLGTNSASLDGTDKYQVKHSTRNLLAGTVELYVYLYDSVAKFVFYCPKTVWLAPHSGFGASINVRIKVIFVLIFFKFLVYKTR